MVIVRGYLGDRIAGPTGAGPALRFVDNPDWANNNILTSLLYAEAEMRDGFLFSYSDIVFSREHAHRVAAATAPVALIVDRRWRDAYQGRTLHPVSEAELTRVAGERRRRRRHARRQAPGRPQTRPPASSPASPASRPPARRRCARSGPRRSPAGLDSPFGAAATLRQAYLSDGLNAIAARGVPLRAVLVDGGWREIDTEQDLARAERGRRRLAVVTCPAAIPATGSTASTPPNGSRPRRPSSPTRRKSCPAAPSAPA